MAVSSACAALFLFACGRESKKQPPEHARQAPAALSPATAVPADKPDAPALAAPTRLTTLPISAYATTLALDDDAVYLLTSHAAYRLVEGQPARGIRLELGIGSALTDTAFVFWSDGGIWSAPKQGGETRRLAKLEHQPQYFVSSGKMFAWVDQSDSGLYTIQTLDGDQPRVLATSPGEIRALNMIGDAVYFVQRPSDDTWRLGRARVSGAAPEYATARKGRAPALLTGQDALYYFDLDQSKILRRSLDLSAEQVQLENFVCSPINVGSRVFCGCVEGLFEVSKDAHEPKVLVHDRPGTIANISSNSSLVAWTVDLGQDQLAVDTLPISATSAHE